MCNRWMNATLVLTVVLISLISISSAAGPRAMPDLYTTGQCGVELSVPAPGILGNDIKSTNPLRVKDPEKITIDPKYGTLVVNADGSFVYDAAPNFPTSTTVSFSYSATDGITVTSPALVKISVSCQCHGAAPDITVCLGTVIITPEYLMSIGAGCIGCRDATPKFDLSKIPAQPVPGATYPYTVSCPACSIITGHVTFVGPCDVSWNPYTVCADVTPSPDEILDNGRVTCSCDTAPVISNIHIVGDHWEYTITCQSVCGPKTVVGRVNIETPCTPTSEEFTVCSGATPTADLILANGVVSCGACDATPAISNIILVGDHWEYTITCTTALGCTKTATGIVNIETPCTPTSTPFTICSDKELTEQMILASGVVSCGACDATPVISDIKRVGDHWEYTITCTTDLGCIVRAIGIVDIEPPCDISEPVVFTNPNCPDNTLPIADQVIALSGLSCGCDATPVISDIHWISTPSDGEWTGEYTYTCTSENGCITSGTGQFIGCEVLECLCEPTAPDLVGCKDLSFPIGLFNKLEGGCHAAQGCDVTQVIDDSGVDYSKLGMYSYTVTCEGCSGNNVATGQIYIRNQLCDDQGHCICPEICA
jgi:VCBS repeat-containing protein